jgi:hypothetical protein
MTKTEIIDSEWDPIYTALDTAQDWGLPTSEYVRVLNEWSKIADGRLEQAVVDMRGEGATWQEVGDALGVTRQAAQQRYGR